MAHRWLAAMLLVAALCLRALVPAGYMPSIGHDRIEVALCNGSGPTTTLDIPMEKHGAKAAERCAFADLSLPTLGGIDPVLLEIALAFVLALWLSGAIAFSLRRNPQLRPPLRGPPRTA